ncbi:epoxide hydrolase family protein [Rhodococcus sp. CH91]|uniref:epoxide hydrolase family protein n=1 Tax=Rhodococcus sp. CH91 TaxID=2910256 RepID=UPI001F4A6AB0|nr:epoxide hydrolase family protein [Rhodococcus sp. CH91]
MPPAKPIREFTVDIPEKSLDDLRERLRQVRLPEPETVAPTPGELDWTQGVPRSYLEELIDYWCSSYDWRRFEARMVSFPQFVTTIFGLDIHFLHVRSQRPDAVPLILTHGWPSSIIEPAEVITDLAEPPDITTPAFHVIAPSLPGFGFSERPAETGWSVDRTADAWSVLMSRLGYRRYVAAGGDWGGRVAVALGVRHPENVAALHTFTPYAPIPTETHDLNETEQRALDEINAFRRDGQGYSLIQSTKPQTIGYALADSPVAQLAWIVEKFHGWTDCDGHPENAVTRDRILDMVSLYWLTGTGSSSAKFYWENFPPQDDTPVPVPTAVTIFPRDLERIPRSWAQARYSNVYYWNEATRGGHFPMLEVPHAYVRELRAALGQIL